MSNSPAITAPIRMYQSVLDDGEVPTGPGDAGDPGPAEPITSNDGFGRGPLQPAEPLDERLVVSTARCRRPNSAEATAPAGRAR